MRITRDSLITLAKDFAALRFREERDLVCIYLTGSMRLPSPLLGGSTDVDLVFVHAKDPAIHREIERINDDVTFDIAHLGQSAFEQPRRLRLDPWLGSYLCENPVLLKENQHWFEFTQAAVCAHFNAPETVLARVKPLAEFSRRLWFSLQKAHPSSGGVAARTYLQAVEAAVNACACLYGPPLTERRFLLDFADLARRENQPALSVLANSLVCDQLLADDFWPAALPAWKESLAVLAATPACPEELSLPRLNYYIKACETLLVDHPTAALWIMLRTWSRAEEITSAAHTWDLMASRAGWDAAGLELKLESLDHFLDITDELFENWARYNGL